MLSRPGKTHKCPQSKFDIFFLHKPFKEEIADKMKKLPQFEKFRQDIMLNYHSLKIAGQFPYVVWIWLTLRYWKGKVEFSLIMPIGVSIKSRW